MVEEIYQIKNEFLQKMRQEIDERGIERVDVAEMYKLADIVKDMAEAEKSCWEAEYYRSVTEAMGGESGYSGSQSGYNGGSGMQGGSRGYSGRSGAQGGSQGGSQGRSGWANQYGSGYRRGYGSGYQEHMDALRMKMQQADPQERERIMQELRGMTNGQM